MMFTALDGERHDGSLTLPRSVVDNYADKHQLPAHARYALIGFDRMVIDRRNTVEPEADEPAYLGADMEGVENLNGAEVRDFDPINDPMMI